MHGSSGEIPIVDGCPLILSSIDLLWVVGYSILVSESKKQTKNFEVR